MNAAESRSSELNSCTIGTQNGAKRIEPDVNAYTIGRGTAAETQLMVTEKMLALVEAAGTWQWVAQPTRSSGAIASASEPT